MATPAENLTADSGTPKVGAADPYASAKATIRDTVKWLAAVFASLAAAVIAGTPFSGLDIAGHGAWVAIVGLMLAFLCIVFALWRTLRLLRPDILFAYDLATPRAGVGLDRHEAKEIESVRAAINRRSADLLPLNYSNVEELADELRCEGEAMLAAHNRGDNADRERHRKRYEQLKSDLSEPLDFAAYLRLYQRLRRETPILITFATFALLFLLLFVLAADKPKKTTDGSLLIVHSPPTKVEPTRIDDPLPNLSPVLFVTGRAEVTSDGLDAIAKALEVMRNNPKAILLLKAYTDTRASDTLNRSLARRRADAVRQRLIAQGGIARNRIFVAELAKTDLPELTEQEIASRQNRSVEFVVIPM
ncbi:MAG: OmpA family protein [Burkholderiales bacterium]